MTYPQPPHTPESSPKLTASLPSESNSRCLNQLSAWLQLHASQRSTPVSPSQRLLHPKLPHHIPHIPVLPIHGIVHPPHLLRRNPPRQPVHRHLDPRMPPQRILPHQRHRLIRRTVVAIILQRHKPQRPYRPIGRVP